MRLRRALSTLLLLTVGSLAGSVLYRRRSARRLELVELYADDGSTVTLADDSADAVRLLSHVRDLLALSAR